jgi:hypothetical protein
MASKIVTSIIRILFLGLLFMFLFYPDKFHIKFDYPGFPQSDSWHVRLAKFAFWFLLTIEILRIFYYGVVKSKAKGLVANIVTIVTLPGNHIYVCAAKPRRRAVESVADLVGEILEAGELDGLS